MTVPVLVTLANEKISIATACGWAGMPVSEGDGSRKIRCPFGDVVHSDGGVEASFRMYEGENGAFCFACSRHWTPVSLMAEVWDCGRREAAERMCQMAGITPPDWRERWEELQQPVPPDIASLAELLKAWCRRVRGPAWETEQFESRMAGPLASCLSVLSLVRTDEDAEAWFDGCKQVMLSLLHERSSWKEEGMSVDGHSGNS
jgi:hypothetical protein